MALPLPEIANRTLVGLSGFEGRAQDVRPPDTAPVEQILAAYWSVWKKTYDLLQDVLHFFRFIAQAVADLDIQGQWYSDVDIRQLHDSIRTDFDAKVRELQATIHDAENLVLMWTGDAVRNGTREVVDRINRVEDAVAAYLRAFQQDLTFDLADMVRRIQFDIFKSAQQTQDHVDEVVVMIRKFFEVAPEDIAERIWKYFRNFFWEKA